MMLLGDTAEKLPLPDAELWYWPQCVAPDRAQQTYEALAAQVAWRQDDITIAGKTIPVPRLNAWYGDERASYCYSGICFDALPWLPVLAALRDEVADRIRADVPGLSFPPFNSVLVNWYRHGQDSVAWHADDEPELGAAPVIASLSFGATRLFQLRHRASGLRREIALAAGSLLVMAGGTQHHWLHQVPKAPGVQAGRINLTFRHIHGLYR